MLEVVNGTIRDKYENGKEPVGWTITKQKCWFVRVVASDATAAIPMEFARKCDATMAMNSIVDIDSWTGTMSEIRDRVYQKVKIEDLQKRMVQNLAW